LKRLGVSPEVFFNMYPRAVHRGGGQYSYEPLSHLRLLKGEYPKLGLTEGQQALYTVIRNANRYLYPGADKFLRRLKKGGLSLILVTHGNPQFQRLKLTHSGIKKYFDKVIFSSDVKVVTLKRLKKRFDEVFFISDHIRELAEVKHHLPELLPIMKVGGHHSDIKKARRLKIPTLMTFREIERLIMKHHNSSERKRKKIR
ncbi:MAG: HAD family hydrolase, partial [Candidatus Veblenbacteria bacterium]|nr:HAD family hydrolase [Candidatus Veblenbacteria bacterium]